MGFMLFLIVCYYFMSALFIDDMFCQLCYMNINE
jgi:hypothetical protein